MTFVWFYRDVVFTGFSFYTQMWSSFEIVIIIYTIYRLLHNAFFYSNASIIAALVQAGHVNEVSKELRKVITSARADGRYNLHTMELIKVSHFLSEHNAVCRLVIAGNRTLWGPVMAAFVLTNLPLNIYALSQIVLSGTKTMFELLSLDVILSIQLLAFVVTMCPLSYTCKRLHAPQSMLVALQAHLIGSQSILLKCKLDALKILLSFGPKVAITIGPAREVTDETMSEVSLF